MNLSQTGELENGALSRQNTVEVRSQHGGGRPWREDEYEGISHGVQSIVHGCERALEGLGWPEIALTARTTSGDVMGADGVEKSVRKEELAGEAGGGNDDDDGPPPLGYESDSEDDDDDDEGGSSWSVFVGWWRDRVGVEPSDLAGDEGGCPRGDQRAAFGKVRALWKVR